MRERKNYKMALKWSILALLLIIALPLVLGISNDVNNNLAAQQTIAYSLNNRTLTSGEYYPGSGPVSFRFYYTNTTTAIHKDLSPFWASNGSWNQVIYPAYTENTSYSESTVISWNLSAAQIMNDNINEIHIKMQGLKSTTNLTRLQILIHAPVVNSNPNGIYNLYSHNIIINNGTIDQTVTIQPAIAAMLNSEYGNTSMITIEITDYDKAHSPFPSNGVVDFKIYATHPHGGIVINGESFVNFIANIYGIIFIAAAIFATGAVNPTHRRPLAGLYYGIKRYTKIKRKKKYHRAREKYHRTAYRPRTTYRRRSTYKRRRW